MTFQKLLANTSITTLKDDETFLFIEIESFQYVFFSYNYELCCFNLNYFKTVDQSFYINNHFVLSESELISLEKSNLFLKLDFEQSDLSTVLGKCLDLYSLDVMNKSGILNEQKDKINSISNIYPLDPKRWKWSAYFNQFILIPNQQLAIRFSLNTYKLLGNTSFQIKSSESNSSIYYLSPYTFLEHYAYIQTSQKNMYIGFNHSNTSKYIDINIRSTRQELTDVIKLFSKENISVQVNIETITMSFFSLNFQSFINDYNSMLNTFLSNKSSLFDIKNDLKLVSDNAIKILPKRINSNIYPQITFTNNLATLQLIVHFVLNNINDTININIVDFDPPSYINISETTSDIESLNQMPNTF